MERKINPTSYSFDILPNTINEIQQKIDKDINPFLIGSLKSIFQLLKHNFERSKGEYKYFKKKCQYFSPTFFCHFICKLL